MGELWKKHQKTLGFAVFIACFLALGLLLQSFSGTGRKPDERGTLSQRGSAQKQRSSEQSATEKTPLPETPPPSPNPPAPLSNGSEEIVPLREPNDSKRAQSDERWILYITGSVRKPGVYKMPVGARLFQLVEAAGGLSNLADPVAINMASPLTDGMHVHVPKKGERQDDVQVPAVIVEPKVVPSEGSRSKVRIRGGSTPQSDPVDINRATVDELTRLKGVGPVLAKNIVEYRTRNGRFRRIDDLLQVRGIGGKKLEGFRNFVTVGP